MRGLMILCTVLAASVAAVLAPAAPADGDPASDYLVQQDTFVPFALPPAPTVAALKTTVATAWAQGSRVKVAVIESPQDLGSVPSLFDRPADYARFLATELSFIYRGPLLVAMPNGFGFVRGAKTDPADQALADRLRSGTDSASLTTAAASAVRALQQSGLLHVKDVAAPTATVQPLHARRGGRVFLRYEVADDSRIARVDLTVRTRQSRTIKSFALPFRRALPGTVSGVVWRVPRSAPPLLRLCVRAVDRAGNRSRVVCASLTVG